MNNVKDFESGNMVKTAFLMAWPAVLESFFTALAGLIDSYMVSSLGPESVAAVGLTTQPKFIGLAVFFAISISVAALTARRRGEGDQVQANRILTAAVVMSVIIAVFLSMLFVYFAPQIISFCGSTPETHDIAVTYYRVIMAGLCFNAIQLVINSGQRGTGNTRISMITNLTSSIVNIIFNYMLIGGHCGFPAMGIRGAAIATVFGTFVASIMSIYSITTKGSYLSLKMILKEKIYPTVKEFRAIVGLGYSILLEQILMRTGFMATALMAAKQGTNAMAAHQVGMNILGLTFSFGDGLQAAAVALIGYSLGQKNREKARAYGNVCQKLGLAVAAVMALVYYFGASWLMHLFFKEQEIVGIGVSIMRMIIFIVFFQITQVIYMGCLRGAGDTKFTALASTVSVTIIRTLGSYIGGYVLGFGIIGIWFGILADQISRFLFGYFRFRQGKWVQIKI